VGKIHRQRSKRVKRGKSQRKIATEGEGQEVALGRHVLDYVRGRSREGSRGGGLREEKEESVSEKNSRELYDPDKPCLEKTSGEEVSGREEIILRGSIGRGSLAEQDLIGRERGGR